MKEDILAIVNSSIGIGRFFVVRKKIVILSRAQFFRAFDVLSLSLFDDVFALEKKALLEIIL